MITLLIGFLMAAGIVLFRFSRHHLALLRIPAAVLVIWFALMTWESDDRVARIHEIHQRTGEIVLGDTGGGAAMLLIGWFPALVIAFMLYGLALMLEQRNRLKSTSLK